MRPALLWLLAIGSPTVADAAEPDLDVADPGAHARATRRAGAISIDGRLDDAGWDDVPAVAGFVERAPQEGATPTEATEFRVAYDDRALYLAIRCFDDHPDEIRGLLTRRDVESASDWVLVGLDSYHDRRTAFVFAVNPAGVQRDTLLYDDSQQDDGWDAVWSSAARVDAHGWSAELRIPLSQLRFSGAPEQSWGIQIVRRVARSGEESSWSPWPRAGDQVVSRFGTLDDIEGLHPGRRLEVLPYASTGLALAADDPANPFDASLDGRFGGGLDVKYGLSSAFTLAATLNPDFGQVEADPSQVNLTGQQSYFPEKRPFFTEGKELFGYSLSQGDGSDNQGEGLFYSRRIGGAPHLTGDDYATYSDTPDATTIYGAAKLSGKTAGGWSVGGLEAVTAEETAALSDGMRPLVVEPLTSYGMVRVLKDLRQGRTTVAGMLTAVDRKLDTPEVTALLHDQAYTGGVDVTHRFGGDRWSTSWKLYGSWVHGSTDALVADQTDLVRLYQRPDRRGVHLDPTRTSLSGAGLLWHFGRSNDRRLNFAVGGDLRTPGLELNDMGFENSADQLLQWAWAGYRHDEPTAQILGWQVNANAWAYGNMEPLLQGFGGDVSANVTSADYWSFAAGANLDRGRWNVTALRGGPRLRAENAWHAWLDLGTDGRKRVSAHVNASVNRRATSDSWTGQLSGTVSVQARSNVELSLGPQLLVVNEDHQYVDQVPDAADQLTYVFARLHEVVASLTVRAAWTFSPHLSVQLYAQPFVAAGAYGEYKQAADTYATAYADRFEVYDPSGVRTVDGVIAIDRDGDGVPDVAVGQPDFDVRELRSTLVARWEYRPGSTVFLIWSHDAASDELTGDLRLGHDLAALASERGADVVMVKATYWVGL